MLDNLKFSLQLVTLLGKLIYTQSTMQHCPLDAAFPDFTAVAGTPFFFNILLHATLKHMRHFQIFLANGKDLPHWMVFRRQSGYLLGLALAEDCGVYHLHLDFSGQNCSADLYVHILDATIPSSSRECPEGEINVWGNLLLKVDPERLNASQRIRLVNTMADHLNQRQVLLFSSNTHHLKKLQVCRPPRLVDKHFKEEGAEGKNSNILWPLGCQTEEQLLFYQLKNAIKTRMLPQGQEDIPVSAWRLLCMFKLPHKMKREIKVDAVTSQESTQMTTFAEQRTSLMNIEHHSTQSETYMTLDDLIFVSAQMFSRTMLDSFEQYITHSSAITLNSYSVTSKGIHVVSITQWLTTRLTSGPHQDWTDVYRDSHPESHSHSALSSADNSGITQDLSPSSVSNINQTENYETSLSDHSLESPSGSPFTQMFSPTSLSSITEQYETSQHLPPTVSGVNQEVMSQLNSPITPSMSTTAMMSHKTQNELEPSLYFSCSLEPTATPPLPSEYISSPRTSDNTNLALTTVEPLKDSLTLQDVSSFTLQSATETESDLCFDQNGQADCSGILLITTQMSNLQIFSQLSEEMQQILSDSQKMNSNLLTQSTSNHTSVSSHGFNLNLNTLSATTSVTYPDQLSIYQSVISATERSNYVGTVAPSTANTIHGQQVSSMITELPSPNLSPTFSQINVTITSMSATILVTQNELESSFHFSFSLESTATTFTPALLSEYISSEPFWTSGNTDLARTTKEDSPTLQEVSSTTYFQSELIHEFKSEQLLCSGIFLASDLTTFESVIEVSQSTQFQQTDFSLLSSLQISDNYPPIVSSEDLGYATESDNFEAIAHSTVQEPFPATTIDLFESLEPSFPLRDSVSVNGCTSTWDSIRLDLKTVFSSEFDFSTSAEEIKYSSISLSSSSLEITYFISSFAHMNLASASARSTPNYLTATTINLFKSLEPSFPLSCNSVGVNRCTSTRDSMTGSTQWTVFSTKPFSTIAEILKHSSIHLKGSSLEITDFISSFALTNSASHPISATSAQSIPNYLSTTTINLFESLEPSFPLCNSMDVNGCFPVWSMSVFSSKFDFATSAEIIKYSSIHLKSSSLEITDFISSVAHTNLASHPSVPISVQSIQNYFSATGHNPADTRTPSHVSSSSVIGTYTLIILSSSAFMGHCVTERSSLLICESSAQVGVTKQTTSFSLYTGILTTSLHASSSDIIRPSTTSATVSSSVHFPPTVLQTIPALTATIGFPFSYSLPQNTFSDPEDGAALSVEMTLIDGPPPNVGSWLALDGLQLHGVPLEVDTHFSPQHVLLSARDAHGHSASLTLTIDFYRNPVEPCHIFTLNARLSLHSLLLHRQKVELLLTKLSDYFNSSSHHHLSLFSITSGSAVVSWYNYSLCVTGQCLYDEIRNMWLAMSSEDKLVNPTFRDAMLPDFPIIDVGPVTYRKDCFPQTPNTASTSNISTLTPIPVTSERVTTYSTMTAMFIALLVICGLILIVLLIAVILYFCQRRPRVVAIWPSIRMLSVQSRDLTAPRPRPAPLLQPEVPPPPLQLWISLKQEENPRPHRLHSDPLQPSVKYKFANI